MFSAVNIYTDTSCQCGIKTGIGSLELFHLPDPYSLHILTATSLRAGIRMVCLFNKGCGQRLKASGTSASGLTARTTSEMLSNLEVRSLKQSTHSIVHVKSHSNLDMFHKSCSEIRV